MKSDAFLSVKMFQIEFELGCTTPHRWSAGGVARPTGRVRRLHDYSHIINVELISFKNPFPSLKLNAFVCVSVFFISETASTDRLTVKMYPACVRYYCTAQIARLEGCVTRWVYRREFPFQLALFFPIQPRRKLSSKPFLSNSGGVLRCFKVVLGDFF